MTRTRSRKVSHAGLVAAAAALAMLSPVALAQDVAPQVVELDITGHDSGADYWFMVEGFEERNPTINLPAGANVIVNFAVTDPANQGHNVHFGEPINEATEIIAPGETATLEFTVPEDATGEGEYWCDPHRTLGMAGVVNFGEIPPENGEEPPDGAEEPPEGAEEEPQDETPGFGAVLTVGALGAALVAVGRRRE